MSAMLNNEAGRGVEAHVAKCPVLNLFDREEPVDGDTDVLYALHTYQSMATQLHELPFFIAE